MSRKLISKPIKRSPKNKAASGLSFDPAVFLATVAAGREISKYSKKKVIFAQGDNADAVFYIKKGKVKVAVVSKQGKEAVVAILGSDEFVGEGCLIGQPKRLATASAMTDCELMRVDKIEIQRVLRQEPAFSEMFPEASTDLFAPTFSLLFPPTLTDLTAPISSAFAAPIVSFIAPPTVTW